MIKAILHVIVRLLFRIKVVGEFQREENHTIIIANHQSFLDGLILGLVLPIKPVFVVNTEIAKRPLVRAFLSLSEYLAIDPSNPMAIKQIIRLVESGRPVVIFPEGRITTTGSLMKIYEGSAFVTVKTEATIHPVIIEGATFSTLSRMHTEHPKRWFPQITLTYCTPTRLRISEGGSAHERRTKSGEAMRTLLQQCIFESRTPNTLFGAFVDAAEDYGYSHRIAEDTKQIEYTYRQVLTMALGLGRLLSPHTAAKEAVGVLMPTAVPTLGLILGLNAFGRTPAMLNFTAGSDGLQSACTAAQINTIITSRAFVEQGKLEPKLEGLHGVTILYLEELRPQMRLIDKLWLMGFARWFPRVVMHKVAPEDTAVILFTSGSEGKPKGVVLSHDAILANIAQLRSIVDFSTEDKMLNALPIFHSFGLTAGTLLPIMGGIPLFLYPSPLHYRVIPEIAYDRSCTILFGTSTFLNHYAAHAHPYDFYRLRYVVAGAEKLSESVKELWFEKFGIRIFEGYGATETAPVIAVNTPMAYRSGTVGQILPGIEAKLISVPGIDEGGILHVKGPNVMSGYLRAERPGFLEKPTSEAGEGWYDTGDIVTIDHEGFVRIAGRVKRFAKIAGEMISLESVEKLALTASPSHFHATSSQSDESRGEALVLFTTDRELKRDTLQQAARERGYPEIAVPRKIVYVDAIPVLGTGKTDYVTLKSMAADA
ncbi:MAG: bifunctional 2-acylglycerophosphoethanolamine acyltransferase/acyl-ACP synthetase [Sulfuricurvum sp. RIFOXYD2_FULL_44_160]|uniref:Bifunctional acyl-ACP--phospholipid O-acyltransferase/long-chain-fatty-acid--ACP ligase n=1 Tax=Sulfuricurvum kujiense TaxID=148813 RepID=A0A2D3WFM9_9BACT|nr:MULTISPECIES: bifunctional acyl-ACP--phospholipid O-acyltransferase/long-chain-fatty-acid--ACP ligase [Sulfuricurvum]OHD92969.1 MAG: bifunctional 2-acylglycerophosphoethanolamine acyltransferase/acyl-ACP synthetase [Sulfuricurvum sp. RIFOXYD12_FULL_44_77]OHD96943.1 MAG: bifunctional 2-acylglycerophosphoethanolamine acyltransferase/acyl-ACP synthetase [Sulfuricurvum sp. RIFOXYD2_FULL_44_160]DAB37547.1 MAG TPA: bifunctional acyl-ACP--phospholipid O-acyltransferase/long-chain-fatty-acid--ACP lig